MKTCKWMPAFLAGCVGILFGLQSVAEVPDVMNFQGRLLDANGEPYFGSVIVGFAIYDQISGGTELWSQSGAAVDVSDGYYSVEVGGASFLACLTNSACWLEVTLDGNILGSRTRLQSVPFALKAGNIRGEVLTVDGSTSRVGIGTDTPSTTLDINGAVEFSSTGWTMTTGRIFKATSAQGDAEWGTSLSGLPAGAVCLWSGSEATIPGGWALCDGTAGTPNLQDRFVVAEGSSHTYDTTGGASSHSHSVDMPSTSTSSAGNHTHTVNPGSIGTSSVGNHSHGGGSLAWNRGVDLHDYGYRNKGSYFVLGTGGSAYSFQAVNWKNSTGGSGGHSHTVDPPNTGSSTAGSHSHTVNPGAVTSGSANHLPPYYALCYIMKL